VIRYCTNFSSFFSTYVSVLNTIIKEPLFKEKWPVLPQNLHRQSLRTLSSFYAARRSYIGECGTVPVRAALVPSFLRHFRKARSVIRDLIYCSGLFFNNSMFVYVYSICSKAMGERRLEFSPLLFTGTHFRKPCQNHVIVRGVFAPHLGTVAQIAFG